jgi:hypothetical protein
MRGNRNGAQPASNVGSPTGAGSAGLADEPAAGARAAVGGQASAGESPAPEAPEPPCLGSLEELNAMGGVTCPPTWCEASDAAHNCGSLALAVSQTSSSECDEPDSGWAWRSVDLQLASGALPSVSAPATARPNARARHRCCATVPSQTPVRAPTRPRRPASWRGATAACVAAPPSRRTAACKRRRSNTPSATCARKVPTACPGATAANGKPAAERSTQRDSVGE